MVPLKVTLDGFLSYREKQTIDFSMSALWMLSGDNGAGKSSVFDAITFAIFGEHRGGSQKAADLINWHRDSFSVSCEFQMGAERYLAERTVEKKGKTTRRLRRWNGTGAWDEMAGSMSDDGFKKHIDALFGMDYNTFTSSVLLRQGKTDRLLEVGPKDRFTLLSQIVGLSRYEELHQKARDWNRLYYHKAEAENTKVLAIAAVTNEAIADAQTAAQAAKTAENAVQKEVTDLTEWAVQSGQWERLVGEAKTLTENIELANNLVANEAVVRKNHDRYIDLKEALPRLQNMRAVRAKHQAAETSHENACIKAEALLAVLKPRYGEADSPLVIADAIDWYAALLSDEVARAQEAERILPHLQTIARKRDEAGEAATEIARLRQNQTSTSLSSFETTCSAEITAVKEAQKTFDAASAAFAQTEARLIDVVQRTKRFAAATTGESIAACLYCAQPLTSQQVADQKARLEAEKRDCEQVIATAQAEKTACQVRLADAQKRHDQARRNYDTGIDAQRKIVAAIQNQENIVTRAERDARAAGRSMFPGDPEGAEPQAQYWPNGPFPQTEQMKAVAKKAAVLPAVRDEKQKLSAAQNHLVRCVDTLHAAREAQTLAEELLTDTWRAWYQSVPPVPDPIAELEKEFATLGSAPGRFTEWEAALRDCSQWKLRLAETENEIARLPEQARRPAEVVEAERDAARTALASARTECRNRENAVEQMQKQKADRDAAIAKRDAHRKEEGNYKTLTDLLGRENLQRILLRDAENDIVGHANEALHNFSQGTLHLSPRPISTGRGGKDEALDLMCSNTQSSGAEGPLPLSNLSGSQKFRVAVALALGIGHFASGSGGGDAARSESVIIDEGFGSLDRHNQQDMADAIRSLADGNYLKRVIVVSHQEAFAAGFNDRIHISLGAQGSYQADPTVL